MITGYFISVSVPEVQVGQDIKATIDFYALNPGAWYWKTFLIVDSVQLSGMPKELDATREIGEGGGRSKTYTIGKMPDREVALSFFLFAHDEAGYDWDWAQYDWWKRYNTPMEATYLDFATRYISPAPTPPIEPDLKVLKYQILGESQGGYINFFPQPIDNEGHYYKGQVVWMSAIANPGYVFVKWRGEVDNPLSTSITNTVTMSENRLVKAEFAKEPVTPPPDGVPPVACSIDSDCPSGYVCRGGVCVPAGEIPPPDGKPEPVNWLPLALLALAVIALTPQKPKETRRRKR